LEKEGRKRTGLKRGGGKCLFCRSCSLRKKYVGFFLRGEEKKNSQKKKKKRITKRGRWVRKPYQFDDVMVSKGSYCSVSFFPSWPKRRRGRGYFVKGIGEARKRGEKKQEGTAARGRHVLQNYTTSRKGEKETTQGGG